MSGSAATGTNHRRGTSIYGAPSIETTATDERPLVCLCPCSFAGHRGSCRVKIVLGETYRLVSLYGVRKHTVAVCIPCWDAIHQG